MVPHAICRALVTLEPGDMVLYESHSVIHGKRQTTCCVHHILAHNSLQMLSSWHSRPPIPVERKVLC